MRTAQQIEYSLIAALESGTDSMFWQSVQTSQLGKELIRFAVETIQQQELIRDKLSSAIDINNADYKQLTILANWMMIFISNLNPATIVVSRISTGFNAAYTITKSLGKANYYNISDVIVGESTQVTLLQGVHKYTKSSAWLRWEPTNATAVNYTVLQYPYGENSFRELIILGRACVDSIRVFTYDQNISAVVQLPKVSPTSVGTLAYVPYNLQDGTVGIFIDSTYVKTAADLNYLVEWLEPTSYSVNSASSDVVSYSSASFDINYARKLLLAEQYKISALTVSNVTEFVNTDSRVVDSIMSNGKVYIKPIDTYLNYSFEDLQDNINLYRAVGTNYIPVATGIPFPITLFLYKFQEVDGGTTMVVANTDNLINTYLSHNNTGYATNLPYNELFNGMSSLGLNDYSAFFCLKVANSSTASVTVDIDASTYGISSFSLLGAPILFGANASVYQNMVYNPDGSYTVSRTDTSCKIKVIPSNAGIKAFKITFLVSSDDIVYIPISINSPLTTHYFDIDGI